MCSRTELDLKQIDDFEVSDAIDEIFVRDANQTLELHNFMKIRENPDDVQIAIQIVYAPVALKPNA